MKFNGRGRMKDGTLGTTKRIRITKATAVRGLVSCYTVAAIGGCSELRIASRTPMKIHGNTITVITCMPPPAAAVAKNPS